jgi:nucleotide-binding universal stress UspA family protein
MSLHIQSILYATDFSESARQALPLALDLARRYDATLHHYHMLVPGESQTRDSDPPPGEPTPTRWSPEQAAQERARAAKVVRRTPCPVLTVKTFGRSLVRDTAPPPPPGDHLSETSRSS